jgi:uncharacterized membrane protein YhfC
VEDGERPLVLESGTNKCWIQDIFVALVHKVDEWQVAELLKDAVLAILQDLLAFFVHQAVVANEKKSFV